MNSGTIRLAGWLIFLFVTAGCSERTEAPSPAGVSESPQTTPSPQPAAESGSQPVVAEVLAYAEVENNLVKGYFVFPENMVNPLPGVVLIHDWWGLDQHARATADRLAAEGFIVLAVDLFGGDTATQVADARSLMLSVVESPQLIQENISAGAAWLRSTTGAPQIAAVGFGFGGGWSLQTAIDAGDAIDAAVIISGQVSDDESVLDALQDPVLGIFAEHDNVVPSEFVAKFEATLGKLGKSGEIEMIADAKRGFADPMSPNYDANLAAQGWSRMVKFLNESLGDSGS